MKAVKQWCNQSCKNIYAVIAFYVGGALFSVHANADVAHEVKPNDKVSVCAQEEMPLRLENTSESLQKLSGKLKVGDVIFTHISAKPFQKISQDTCSWANHVGIVVDISGAEPIVAESKVPLSKKTPLHEFIGRSEHGQYLVKRLEKDLSPVQQLALRQAVDKRMSIFYDTGFDLFSSKQFCSRFVREVLEESAHISVGEKESLASLLKRNPQADQTFWKVWFFGKIPWHRVTVTPASVLHDKHFHTII